LNIVECPVETTLSLIGGKWKVLVIKALATDKKRYNELRRLIPEVSAKVLTAQLNEMIADHLIKKTIYPEIPPRTEYELTEIGISLLPVLVMLRVWGTAFKEKIGEEAYGELFSEVQREAAKYNEPPAGIKEEYMQQIMKEDLLGRLRA
jgi:Predicted transcriptional regulators